ncbi:NUDIX hydrolase [Aquimarina agarilytica]|uniref:NUDIX hydrolase n=1 Tax=Aquimarina agarilytica TaxID=1087449 RepID=UPI000288EB2E|nr:NUDIX domain-containing protein [Aquimarina agarilytica]
MYTKIVQKSRLIAIMGDHILVLEKNQKKLKYSLPGGVKKKNETASASLKRETIEEIGVHLDTSKLELFTTALVLKNEDYVIKNYYVIDGFNIKPQNLEPHKFFCIKWIPWQKAVKLMDKTDKKVVEEYFFNIHISLANKNPLN